MLEFQYNETEYLILTISHFLVFFGLLPRISSRTFHSLYIVDEKVVPRSGLRDGDGIEGVSHDDICISHFIDIQDDEKVQSLPNGSA